MSYCRFAEGDVYLIGQLGGFGCYGCRLENVGTPEPLSPSVVEFRSRKAALTHLMKHRAAGHKVPDRAVDRLKSEIAGEKG